MASGPCLRRCRVVRRYMPRNIQCHRCPVKLYTSIHVSMYLEPFREVSAVNTGVPCPKIPIHRKLRYTEIADNRHGAKLPENPVNLVLSGQKGMLITGWAS